MGRLPGNRSRAEARSLGDNVVSGSRVRRQSQARPLLAPAPTPTLHFTLLLDCPHLAGLRLYTRAAAMLPLLGVASSARGSGGTSGAHGRILSAVAEPALLNEHWLLENGSAHRCPAGRRGATEEECLAAVREAASRDGLEVFGLKRVNDGAASFVPAGCSYSSHSKTAVFNANAAGGRVLGSNRLACLAPPEAVPSGAEDECPRQCSDALSVIDLRSIPRLHTGPAGLSDWAFQLEGEGNLAAHLCAQALVPSPADALAPDHNNGARVGPDVPWSRYFVFNATAGWSRDTPVWVSPQTSRNRWLERVRDTSGAAPLELTANSVEDVLAQYDQLARLVAAAESTNPNPNPNLTLTPSPPPRTRTRTRTPAPAPAPSLP